jgi:hypothetical protein
MDQSPVEVRAEWVAAQNIGCFRDLINVETEEGQNKVLAHLLSKPPRQRESAPVSDAGVFPVADFAGSPDDGNISFVKACWVTFFIGTGTFAAGMLLLLST